jgi:hypothetical protein
MAFCSPSMTTKDGRNLWTKAYAIETEKSSSMKLLCLVKLAYKSTLLSLPTGQLRTILLMWLQSACKHKLIPKEINIIIEQDYWARLLTTDLTTQQFRLWIGSLSSSSANHPRLVSASLVEGWIVGLVAAERFKRHLPSPNCRVCTGKQNCQWASIQLGLVGTYGSAKAKLYSCKSQAIMANNPQIWHTCTENSLRGSSNWQRNGSGLLTEGPGWEDDKGEAKSCGKGPTE